MRMRMLSALAVCLLVSAIGAGPAAANYPGHEVWIGVGGGASFEKSIFNVPDDIKSTPELVLSLGYMKNLNERSAVGFHIYGGTETTPEVTLVGPGGTQRVKFELNTYNIGFRYRHTFSRGGISPYAFVGASWANGIIDSAPTGQLEYNGISTVAGPGASVSLGRHFLLTAEGIGSFGVANWESAPFDNSTGKEFNPSLAGGTLNLSFVWGRQP